ncbi:hypothetical protein LTR62_005873 [Meristemomyces frigidus]|uniref:Agglutinin-like protein n=1 Tax=Meristemomyces frigidus TaxID=1508187 RepID=A0AAN7TVW1_9PEZI|nr:hypothetical protein LTR62_005873 [Meristemomyces frigidus]
MRLPWITAFVALRAGLAASRTNYSASDDSSSSSQCLVFGVDYQSDQSYFINSASTANFTLVEQFANCGNTSAHILFVNDETLDEYECTMVLTAPEDVSQMSSCPVKQGSLSSGNYTIITMGTDAEGDPFAYQRDFFLSIGAQATVTVTSTADWTVIVQSTSTVKVTSTVTQTSTVSNDNTVTSNVAGTLTLTPSPVLVPETNMLTATFYSWTTTRTVLTATTTPSCTVPPRAQSGDDWLRFKPTAVSLPPGLQIQSAGGHPKAREVMAAPPDARAGAQKQSKGLHLHKRAPNAATVTSTTTVGGTKTTTLSAKPTTITETDATTAVHVTTSAAQTLFATEITTITGAVPTETSIELLYQRDYISKTMSITWTKTLTSTPAAMASSCACAGGNFGYGYGGYW